MINPKYAKTLELDKILRMLAELCHYDTAKEKALAIVPLTDVDDVCRELGRTDDLFQLTVRFGTPSFIGFHNPCGRLKIASQGGSLSPVPPFVPMEQPIFGRRKRCFGAV